MSETITTVRGCDIGWERAGLGVDVVWGHGLTQSRELEDRRPMVHWAGIGARVLRYDARGHGRSQSTPDLDGYGWDELARDQLALVDAVGIDRYVAAGASMGAATALHAAVIAPHRVLGLVLVIPPTGWETRADQIAVYEQGAEIVAARGVEPLIRAGEAIPPPDPLAGDPEYRALRAEALRSWDPQRLALAMRGATRAQLPTREAIASIGCPCLVLAWSGDAGHPVSTADELRALIPHADLRIASTVDDMAAWSNTIGEFLDTM